MIFLILIVILGLTTYYVIRHPIESASIILKGMGIFVLGLLTFIGLVFILTMVFVFLSGT